MKSEKKKKKKEKKKEKKKIRQWGTMDGNEYNSMNPNNSLCFLGMKLKKVYPVLTSKFTWENKGWKKGCKE